MVGERLPHSGSADEPAPTSCPAGESDFDGATGDVTRILSRIESGDPAAADQLLPLVYEELRRLAASRMARELPGQTLQATALVHEAYIRLVDGAHVQRWDSRGHFFAAAAEAMRRLLIETARRKLGPRAGGGRLRHELNESDQISHPVSDELLDLDAALSRLEKSDSQAAGVVKLKVFSGMTVEEIAQYQRVSPRTVKRTWAYARAWLAREVRRDV